MTNALKTSSVPAVLNTASPSEMQLGYHKEDAMKKKKKWKKKRKKKYIKALKSCRNKHKEAATQ